MFPARLLLDKEHEPMAGRRTDKRLDGETYRGIRYEMYLTPDDKFKAVRDKGGKPEILAFEETAQKARWTAQAKIDTVLSVDWQEAITVSIPTVTFPPSPHYVTFSFSRCLMGYSEARGLWLSENWNTPPEIRMGSEMSYYQYIPEGQMSQKRNATPIPPVPKSLPWRFDNRNGTYGAVHMAYTEERWNALNELAERMKALQKAIRQIMGEEDLRTLQALVTPAITGFAGGAELLAIAAPNAPETPVEGAQEADTDVIEGQFVTTVGKIHFPPGVDTLPAGTPLVPRRAAVRVDTEETG